MANVEGRSDNSKKTLRILLVDDEPTIERLFQQRFKKDLEAGLFSLIFAKSGFQAMDLVRKEGTKLDLILTDVNMPEMSGIELIKNLRKEGFILPVYLFSAYDEETLIQKSRGVIPSGYLQKPLDFEKIREIFISPLHT